MPSHISRTARAAAVQEAESMGRLLSRDEARAHDRLKEVLHITDHMVVDDMHLRAFFTDAT